MTATNNLPLSQLVDSLVANYQGSTRKIPVGDLSRQLAASGEIAEQLQAASVGRLAYATRAELLATTAPEGAVALVTNDGNAAFNGQYRRTATTWTRFADLDNAALAQEIQAARATSTNLGLRLDEIDATASNAAARLVTAAALPSLAEAGVALAFVDRDSGAVAAWVDRDGRLHADVKGAPARLPVPARDYVPAWGAERDGRFMGFDIEGEVIGEVGRAVARAGLAPDGPGHGLDWQLVFRGRDGNPILATRPQGGIIDFGRARAPVIGTEWLTAAGVRVAPLAAGAVECVVAYFHHGERRVLTPPQEGLHHTAPELAYGGISVRCWRHDGAGAGSIVAVSIARPGFVVDDDPDLAWIVMGDGQSLAQGSHGVGTPWPYRSVDWPDHLLTVDNSLRPGDIRTGRNANAADFLVDPATLTGLTSIRPQPGVGPTHGLTPLEALVCALQDDIVQLIGRPQRIIAWTGGAGGTAIANLGVGSANEANQQQIMTAAVRFAAMRWTHGESDATAVSQTYANEVSAYRAALDGHAMALTGQTEAPIWLVAQPSSFAESIDSETDRTSVIGMMLMMAARPADTFVTGPGYPDQEHYLQTDMMHMTNLGYLAQGEADAGILRAALWGGAEDRPLLALSAEISGAVITVTWSEPVEIAPDMPARPHLGVEVSTGTDSFLTINSHTLNGAQSTITLSAAPAPGDIANLRLQIGMTGQSQPERLPGNVPGTQIRTIRAAYRSYRTGRMRHRYALHQRISLTQA